MDLDSNSKCLLSHMRIADNNRNNRVDVDSNHIMRMRMSKSDNRILRMRIYLMTTSGFSPLVNTSRWPTTRMGGCSPPTRLGVGRTTPTPSVAGRPWVVSQPQYSNRFLFF